MEKEGDLDKVFGDYGVCVIIITGECHGDDAERKCGDENLIWNHNVPKEKGREKSAPQGRKVRKRLLVSVSGCESRWDERWCCGLETLFKNVWGAKVADHPLGDS